MLVAIAVAATAGVVVGPKVFGSHTRSSSRPFDLRSIGVSCRADHAWVCGSIRVPLDRRSPSAGSIAVRFRVLPRRLTTKQSAGTVVVVNGGPGSSSMSQHKWAQKAFRSLHGDHDLLLVDNRGTGASGAIDCPKAQESFSTAAIAQCRKILGKRAVDYSTVAAVDDLAAVLTRIHSRAVDLYGESYGTFFAQVFALRHPQHLERLVLDGALGLAPDPWGRDSLRAGLAALRATCRANLVCPRSGDPGALIGKALLLMRAAAPPGRLADDARAHAAVLAGAGRGGATYRELPAALRAYIAGDDVPLYRLFGENESGRFDAGLETTSFSNGLLLAATCADEPQPFDLRADVSVQKRQLNAAYRKIVTSSPRAFLPFTPEEFLNRGSAPVLCLGWPAPTTPPLGLQHQTFPDVPTLVLEGGLDTVTPPPVARAVAHQFRHSWYVEIPFVRHVAALNDHSGCAAKIAAAFIRSSTIDAACRSDIAAPDQVDVFPATFADEAPIHLLHTDERAGLSADDLRTVAIARDAIADVVRRWGPLGFYADDGLRAGSFRTISPLVRGEFRVHLDGIGWTNDTAVSGELETSDVRDTMSGYVFVSTPWRPTVRFEVRAAHIFRPGGQETVAGTIDGRKIRLTVDAKLGL
jgi:pimeloyl-ACP methyl ester carboxylesterase